MPTPVKLDRVESQGRQYLVIVWDNGQETVVSTRQLQENCPCANCGEKRQGKQAASQTAGGGGAAGGGSELFPLLNPSDLAPIQIVAMRAVGNYAYGIEFNGGCNQGIYTLDHLWHVASEAAGET